MRNWWESFKVWIGIGIKIGNWARSLVSGPFNSHATLTDGLVSAWPISADGVDVHGSNDLTNNNTVTFVAKGAGAPANMPANVANFVPANNQFFSRASNASLQTGEVDFAAAGWFYSTVASDGLQRGIISKGNEWFFKYGGTRVAQAVTAHTDFNFYDSSSVSPDVWHFYYFEYDPAANKNRLQIDGGALLDIDTTLDITVTTDALNIGAVFSAATQIWGGKLSSQFFWKGRRLTSAERTDLWNSGDGLFY